MEEWLEPLTSLDAPTRTLCVALVFIVANALFIPATFLSLVTGFLLPFPLALGLASSCRSFVAFMCSFLARRFLHEPVQAWSLQHHFIHRIQKAFGQEGWRSIFLLRLSPIFPSGPTNYLLGLMPISLGAIFFGTLLGTLPNTLICVAAGSGLASLAQVEDFELWHSDRAPTLLALGLVATLILLWRLRRAYRQSGSPAS